MKYSKNKKLFFIWGFSATFTAFSIVAPLSATAATSILEQRFHITNIPSLPAPSALSTSATSTASTDRITTIFQSETFHLSASMNAVGLRWSGVLPREEDILFQLHVFDAMGIEVASFVLPHLGDDVKAPLPSGMFATRPVIMHDAHTIRLEIQQWSSAQSAPQINNIEIITYNTNNVVPLPLHTLADDPVIPEEAVPPPTVPANPAINPLPVTAPDTALTSQQVTATPPIISRATWSADETYRLKSDGTTLWQESYQDPEVFIVHHTAGGDGGDDPAATVRAIYYWHAVVLGWGDIGYNYLIDPKGNIYEGRFGGDGVVGGHTFNDQLGINYNEGSIGIALLGCFEETADACGTLTTETDATREALAKLIAAKASQFHLAPDDTTTLHGTTTARVVGHRDLDATYCPGSFVHNALTDLRAQVLAYYNDLNAPQLIGEFTALAVRATDGSERILATTTPTLDLHKKYWVKITYNNTGTAKWRRTAMRMKVYNKLGRGTSLRHTSWNDHFGKIRMKEQFVDPGETATFAFRIRAPKTTDPKTLITRLVVRKRSVQKTRVMHLLNFTDTATTIAVVPSQKTAAASMR